jgi:glycosyltransferase involved in cell wall biosynthesis
MARYSRARSVYRSLPAPVQRGLKKALRPGSADVEAELAKARFDAEDYPAADRYIEAGLEKRPTNSKLLDLAARSAAKQGRISDALEHATYRSLEHRGYKPWSQMRGAAARLVETDASWRPTVVAAPPQGPAGDGVIYLAKESRPYLHNGFCTRTHETLRWLIRTGHPVTGVTMPGFPGVIGVADAPASSTVEEVVYHHLLPSSGAALKRLPLDEQLQVAAQALAGVVARERPRLLHIGSGHRGYETALVGDAVARWAGIPWIYEVRSFFETTWTADVRYMEQGEYYRRRFETESRMMHAADLVVTLSGPMRDEIIDKHGVPADKVRVVPNAVDTSRFAPQQRDEALRASLGLTGTKTLGYVSNLDHPREGQEVLVDAVAELRRQGYPATGLIVGDGNRRPGLIERAKAAGVAEHVVFTGKVPFDDVAAYYAQIDLFVVPRIDERAARMVSPMKPFEAMAMRIPNLVADLPALVEISGGGTRAGLFKAGDPSSLAAEARRLLDSPETLAAMADAADTWVRAERSWEASAAGFADAYDAVLSGRA